jgi:hypothetical protein
MPDGRKLEKPGNLFHSLLERPSGVRCGFTVWRDLNATASSSREALPEANLFRPPLSRSARRRAVAGGGAGLVAHREDAFTRAGGADTDQNEYFEHGSFRPSSA